MENLNRYWCFYCQNHFQAQKQTNSCSMCHSGAVQLTQADNNHPLQFDVYQIPNQNHQQPQNQTLEENQNQEYGPLFNAFFDVNEFTSPFGFPPIVSRQIRIIHFADPLELINPLIGENGLLSLLNSIRGQGNLVPASQQDKNRLKKVQKVNECSVCQEEDNNESRKGYTLPCRHSFHIDCLDPWLERTNTCPTCRAHI